MPVLPHSYADGATASLGRGQAFAQAEVMLGMIARAGGPSTGSTFEGDLHGAERIEKKSNVAVCPGVSHWDSGLGPGTQSQVAQVIESSTGGEWKGRRTQREGST
ncbi:hypothetical protein VDGL01_03929 [Verticillium dahliae]